MAKQKKFDLVCGLALLYGTASLIHHLHNTIYLSDYPNMPRWLTPAGVMGAWCFIAIIGAIGGLLIYYSLQTIGYIAFVVFAMLGFCGLDHYAIAKVSEHSFWMNATIFVEVATALTLFLAALIQIPRVMRREDELESANA